ncbi:hypothetical protein ABID47_001483 [Paenibacillus favisporus]|uniref:Uncharacterized protein n=1 Tax=Paenibacillus favisporus TaxID=221028 RepID=A0ABV2EZE3_9BACL
MHHSKGVIPKTPITLTELSHELTDLTHRSRATVFFSVIYNASSFFILRKYINNHSVFFGVASVKCGLQR